MQYQLHHPDDDQHEDQHEAHPEVDEVAGLALTEVPLPCPVALHTEGAEKYGAEHLSKAQSVAGCTVLWLLVLAAAVLVVFAHGCLLRELTGRAHNRISAQCLRLHSMAKITEAMTRYRLCNSHTASSPPPSTGPMR